MFFRLKNTLNKAWFNLNARAILDTPSIQCDPRSHLLVLTQTYHPDLYMYLLAAKSFARFVRPASFIIVDDGLTEHDKTLIRHHLDTVSFISTNSIDTSPCPRGGTWERLITIARLASRNYVIQLDADTLTLSRPDEVIECIESNRPFTLGTSTGKEIISAIQACEYASQWQVSHVQNHAERSLKRLADAEAKKYVRGCSGFAGFPRGPDIEENIHAFSLQMENLLGPEKWREWGSEQVTSNFTIANLPRSTVLPPTRYPFWKPGIDIDQAALVHFFGTFRFSSGMYVRQARWIRDQLLDHNHLDSQV